MVDPTAPALQWKQNLWVRALPGLFRWSPWEEDEK